jgi:hypothetical protein
VSEEKMREAFEAHQLSRYQYADISRHPDGRYWNDPMESEWETWQAALQESEAGAVAWMWRRDYAVGGFSTELCNTREQAESLLERFTEGGTVDSIHPLYTSQTTATQAAVAAAMMKCADLCKRSAYKDREDDDSHQYGVGYRDAGNNFGSVILTSIPAEATAALRELMIEAFHAGTYSEYHHSPMMRPNPGVQIDRILTEKGLK